MQESSAPSPRRSPSIDGACEALATLVPLARRAVLDKFSARVQSAAAFSAVRLADRRHVRRADAELWARRLERRGLDTWERPSDVASPVARMLLRKHQAEETAACVLRAVSPRVAKRADAALRTMLGSAQSRAERLLEGADLEISRVPSAAWASSRTRLAQNSSLQAVAARLDCGAADPPPAAPAAASTTPVRPKRQAPSARHMSPNKRVCRVLDADKF